MKRTINDLCLLCGINHADKKNSHIIPKFFRERLFPTEGQKHMIHVSKKRLPHKIQDIPKEDNILCFNCEKRFEILETYCANQLFKKVHYEVLKIDEFSIQEAFIDNALLRYLECKVLNPFIFNLFIKSIVWRASISNYIMFKNFHIPQSELISIKEELHKHLKTTQVDLLKSVEENDFKKGSSFILFTLQHIGETPRSTLSSDTIKPNLAVLNLVDYTLLYSTFDDLPFEFKCIENFNDGNIIKIGIIGFEGWTAFHNSYLFK